MKPTRILIFIISMLLVSNCLAKAFIEINDKLITYHLNAYIEDRFKLYDKDENLELLKSKLMPFFDKEYTTFIKDQKYTLKFKFSIDLIKNRKNITTYDNIIKFKDGWRAHANVASISLLDYDDQLDQGIISLQPSEELNLTKYDQYNAHTYIHELMHLLGLNDRYFVNQFEGNGNKCHDGFNQDIMCKGLELNEVNKRSLVLTALVNGNGKLNNTFNIEYENLSLDPYFKGIYNNYLTCKKGPNTSWCKEKSNARKSISLWLNH